MLYPLAPNALGSRAVFWALTWETLYVETEQERFLCGAVCGGFTNPDSPFHQTLSYDCAACWPSLLPKTGIAGYLRKLPTGYLRYSLTDPSH